MPTADSRFFQRTGPHPLSAIRAVAGLAGERGAAGSLPFTGVAPLQTAEAAEISFLDNRKYLPALRETRAGAVIVGPSLAAAVPAGVIPIVTPKPYEVWAKVAALFHPAPPPVAGIHPSAVISGGAEIDPSAEIGALAVIGEGAAIGPRCRIAPHAVIGARVTLGPDCRIGAHASVSHAVLGARVYIYPGARVGQEGFGFAVTDRGFLSVPQLGMVVIGDDVEIGANTTVDRGSLHDTRIGAGTRIDNLVQIAHNVQIGRCCAIAAQVGISGSAVLEDFVMAGGQAGLVGHLRVGAGAKLGAQAGIMNDVPAGAEYTGSPATPARDQYRQLVVLRRLARVNKAGAAKVKAGAD